MTFKIKMEDPHGFLQRIQQTLLSIEVKGSGVEYMYNALSAVKQLYDSIEEVPEEKEPTEKIPEDKPSDE